MQNPITFVRVKNDVNGNPRYVTHFLNLDTLGYDSRESITERYSFAVKLANGIGGRKYHTKSYGGGIVFQSYSLDYTVSAINKVTGKKFDGYICI